MRKPSLPSLLGLALLGLLTILGAAGAAAQTGYGGRPPQLTPYPTSGTGYATPVPPGPAQPAAPAAFAPVSLFGMNLYLTGLERSNAQVERARRTGRAGRRQVVAGRAVLGQHRAERQGPVQLGHLRQPPGLDAANGINVVGMLLTTPRWASTQPWRGRLLLVRAAQL